MVTIVADDEFLREFLVESYENLDNIDTPLVAIMPPIARSRRSDGRPRERRRACADGGTRGRPVADGTFFSGAYALAGRLVLVLDIERVVWDACEPTAA